MATFVLLLTISYLHKAALSDCFRADLPRFTYSPPPLDLHYNALDYVDEPDTFGDKFLHLYN